jgi:hypothetical protein
MSALNIRALPVCVFPHSVSKSPTIWGACKASVSRGYRRISGAIARYWYAVAAAAVLFDYSRTTAHMPAAIVIRRSTPHRNATKTAVDASPPRSSASGSAACLPTLRQYPPSPNGHAVGPTNAFVTKSKPSKPKLRHNGSRSLSAHSSSPITSDGDIGSYFQLSKEQTWL